VAIFLYADYVVTAGVVLCASYAVAANTSVCGKRKVWVKRFADACCKSKEGIIRGVICPKNKESVQSREKVVVSLIEVELRRS
jgi:hypothetical protein